MRHEERNRHKTRVHSKLMAKELGQILHLQEKKPQQTNKQTKKIA